MSAHVCPEWNVPQAAAGVETYYAFKQPSSFWLLRFLWDFLRFPRALRSCEACNASAFSLECPGIGTIAVVFDGYCYQRG